MPAARIVLYTATIGAIALTVRSILRGPMPMWIALALLGVYVAIVMSGVLFLRLRMFVDAVCRGPEDARGVALTFDDGPSPEHTPKVLAMLDAAKIRATFFVIGKKAEANPELVRLIAEKGHVIGSHGYAHSRLFSLLSRAAVREDVERSLAVIEAITGKRPRLFRPPIGHTNPRIASVVSELGLSVIGWSVRAIDGLASSDPERAAARVVRGLEDGAIVLLHDAAERDDHEPASLKALPRILSAMRAKHLTGVTVRKFLEHQ